MSGTHRLLFLNLHVLQSPSSQETEAWTGSLLQSRCTELLAKPRRQSLAGGCCMGAWCTLVPTSPRVPEHTAKKWESRALATCRSTWWRGGEIGMQGLCWLWWGGDLNSELPSPSNQAPSKTAVGVVAEAVPLCGKKCTIHKAAEIAQEKGAWLSSLSEVLPWELPSSYSPIQNPQAALRSESQGSATEGESSYRTNRYPAKHCVVPWDGAWGGVWALQ